MNGIIIRCMLDNDCVEVIWERKNEVAGGHYGGKAIS
jgi:hypothetical protein